MEKSHKVFSLVPLSNTAVAQTLLHVSNINTNVIRPHTLLVTSPVHKYKQLRRRSQRPQLSFWRYRERNKQNDTHLYMSDFCHMSDIAALILEFS